MVEFVRGALGAGHPLEMLGLVGLMVETLLPHEFSYPTDREHIDPNPGIDAIASLPFPEYTAALAVFAEIAVGDADLQDRCRKALGLRADTPPQWIVDLPRLEIYRAVRVTEVLGDRDQVMFGVRLADGHELTCGVVIDHMGVSTVRDIGLWPDGLDAIVAQVDRSAGDVDVVDMSLADARAWIEKGFEFVIFPRFVEKRPGFHALLRWLTDQLPGGGQPFDRRLQDWRVTAELVDSFFASPQGTRFDRAEFGDVLESLMDEGTGDPLRWSVYRITYMFRGFADDDRERSLDTVLRIPALLRAFIPVAHARSGIRDELTARALAALDDVQTSIEERVRSGLQEYWDRACWSAANAPSGR